jgi:hypothetical protein
MAPNRKKCSARIALRTCQGFSVEASVLDGFGDVGGGDLIPLIEVGDRSGDF